MQWRSENSESTFLESPPESGNYVQEITVEPTRNMTDTLNDELAIERATADIVVRTDRRGPRSVVNDILRRVSHLTEPLGESVSLSHQR